MIFPLLGFQLLETLEKKTAGKVHTPQCSKQKHTVFPCVSSSNVQTTEAPHNHVVRQSEEKAAKHTYIHTSPVDVALKQSKNSNSDKSSMKNPNKLQKKTKQKQRCRRWRVFTMSRASANDSCDRAVPCTVRPQEKQLIP